jgi:hypothetical protein
VDSIVTRLKDDGFDVWIDRANIKGGDLWTVAIVEAIDTADAFLLMLSPNATASDNVRKEVQLAQDANRRLFPLLLAAVKLPPQFRYQLAGIQWIDYASDPKAKYRELIEVLGANRESLTGIKRPETRQAEVVISEEKLSKFGTKKRGNLLDFIANITGARRADIHLTNLSAGSVHAFINMPAHTAYVLKTAALNRDSHLLKYGIAAMRLDGEENYVLVKTGEIGPLNVKRRSSCLARLLLILLGLGMLAGALYVAVPTIFPTLEPSITIPTRKPTKTPTKPPPPTSVVITPFKPDTVSNVPPTAPELVSPQHQSTISCEGAPVFLDWNESYDADGIAGYEIQLDVDNKAWVNIIDKQVSPQTTELEIGNEVYKYCGHWLRWQVRAMDPTNTWGDWSSWSEFWMDYPPPAVVAPANIPPSAPAIVSPQDKSTVNCDGSNAILVWQEPYDSDGISGYEVELYVDMSGQWNLVFAQPVASAVTKYDISKEVNAYCGYPLSWRVRAQDTLGEWGDWSSQPAFLTEVVKQ